MTTEPIDLDAAQALADAATPGPWTPREWTGERGTFAVCRVREYADHSETVVAPAVADEVDQADSAFIAQARTLVPALIAELRRIRRGAQTLGEMLHRTNMDVLDAVGAHDLIAEDGDGDWACVYELLAELRPDRDRWKARAESAEAAIGRVKALAFSEGVGQNEEDLILTALEGGE